MTVGWLIFWLLTLIGLGFSVWLLGSLWAARPSKLPTNSAPLSPIDRYVAGGGDMSTAPAGVVALLAEAERGWNRNHAHDGEVQS